jgi:signal transduction histidine kinase
LKKPNGDPEKESQNNQPMEPIQLQRLVNKIVAEVAPATARHGSFIVNDIPTGMEITANTEEIATVLGQLFSTLARHASDSCIRITARNYSNVVLVQVRDRNSPASYTIAQDLQPAQQMAERLGGYLGVTSQRRHESTIVFSFPNLDRAS